VKFFAWLFCNDRLPTRANLLYKHILLDEDTSCPSCSTPTESAEHLFYECGSALDIWLALSIGTTGTMTASPWMCHYPQHLPADVWDDVLLIILWRIWNRCNDVVFRSLQTSTAVTLRLIATDIDTWSHRFRDHTLKLHLCTWRSHVLSALMA